MQSGPSSRDPLGPPVESAGAARPAGPGKLSWILLGAAAAAALAYSIATNPGWRSFDAAVLMDTLRGLDWAWLGAALLLIYGTYIVRALRWRLLMQRVKPDAGVWNLISATVIGFGAIGVLGRAGELVRPYLIARKEGVAVSGQMAVWVVERVFDMLSLLAFVAFSLGEFDAARTADNPELRQWVQSLGYAVGVLTVLLLVFLAVIRGFYRLLAARLLLWLRFLPASRWRPLRRNASLFGDGLEGLSRSSSLLACILLSCLTWVLVGSAYWAILISCRRCPAVFGFSEALVFMGIVMAGSILQIPAVGGGVQVASLLALTEVLGLGVEVASGLSLVFWVLTFLAVVPPAAALMAAEGLGWGKLRELQSET